MNKHTLEMTDKINGKIVDTQQIKLSSDLKTLTITVHPVGRSEPNILVFESHARGLASFLADPAYCLSCRPHRPRR